MSTGDGPVAPRLVTVAHGTRHGPGNDVAREICAAAAARLGVPGTSAYVELAEPLLTDVVATTPGPGVVVPLLLSTGFHVRSDLPAMLAGSAYLLGRRLGPHALLASAMADRLREAGAEPGCPVVLVAAGSSDPLATPDLVRAADLLGTAWGAPARVATLSGRGERPAEVVRPGDAVAPYLLAGGFFSRRLADEARAAGAGVVAGVIGAHDAVIDLVVRRARALLDVSAIPGAGPDATVGTDPRVRPHHG
ncbi:sirohydrochlorin chelatase [Nocardioides sp. SYSU DS0663]|uniref:sirohydrochlorin chelatase n=1 Tax=Nocardioides sp. SYSU DS0663 TaxID=3416445 RepID=UPI003F4BBB66